MSRSLEAASRVNEVAMDLKKEEGIKSVQVVGSFFDLVLFPEPEKEAARVFPVVLTKIVFTTQDHIFLSKYKDTVEKLQEMRLRHALSCVILVRFAGASFVKSTYSAVRVSSKYMPLKVVKNDRQKFTWI